MTFAVAAVLTLLVAFVVPMWLIHRSKHDGAAAQSYGEVGTIAEALIGDPTVPLEIVHLLSYLVHRSSTPRLSRNVVWGILSGAYDRRREAAVKRPTTLSNLMDQLSEDQRLKLGDAVVHALLASASTDLILAVFTRRIILWGLTTGGISSEPEKARSVVVEMEPRVCHDEPRFAMA